MTSYSYVLLFKIKKLILNFLKIFLKIKNTEFFLSIDVAEKPILNLLET